MQRVAGWEVVGEVMRDMGTNVGFNCSMENEVPWIGSRDEGGSAKGEKRRVMCEEHDGGGGHAARIIRAV